MSYNVYEYRRGDGNDGNFVRAHVRLPDGANVYAALEALTLNDYVSGRYTRRFIRANMNVDGEPEYGVHLTVYEGPRRATAFGAAWLTSELRPYATCNPDRFDSLEDILDRGALAHYRKRAGEI